MKVIFLVVLLGLMAQVAATATAPEDAVAGKTQCAFQNEVNDPFLWETDKCASGSAKLYCSPFTAMCKSAPTELPECGACMKVTHNKEGEDPCVTGIKACLTTEKNPWEECTNEDQEQFFGWMTGEKCMAALRATTDDGHDDHPVKFCGGGMYVKNKDTHDEKCEKCPAGKFSKDKTFRNRRCKKCPENTYMPFPNAKSCVKCPADYNTKDQRGKKQCFDASGVSMKALNIDPKEYAREAKDEPVDFLSGEQCLAHRRDGGCKLLASPITLQCVKTCGEEWNKPITEKVDKRSEGECADHKAHGDCNSNETEMKEEMNEFCAKTCSEVDSIGDGDGAGNTTGGDPTDGGITVGKSCTYTRECGDYEICSGYDYNDYDSAKTYQGECILMYQKFEEIGVHPDCTPFMEKCFEDTCLGLNLGGDAEAGKSYYNHEGPDGYGNSACCLEYNCVIPLENELVQGNPSTIVNGCTTADVDALVQYLESDFEACVLDPDQTSRK